MLSNSLCKKQNKVAVRRSAGLPRERSDITMARTKRVPFAPWETRYANGIEKRFIRLGATQMASEAMRKLSSSAFRIYISMRLESGGHREFTFPHTKYAAFMSKPTFFRVLKELEEAGFIDIVSRNKNLRISNEYRFSERWKTL